MLPLRKVSRGALDQSTQPKGVTLKRRAWRGTQCWGKDGEMSLGHCASEVPKGRRPVAAKLRAGLTGDCLQR